MLYFYSLLTIFAFLTGLRISQKLRSSVLNPFVIALAIVCDCFGNRHFSDCDG